MRECLPPLFTGRLGGEVEVAIDFGQAGGEHFVSGVFGAASRKDESFGGLDKFSNETRLRPLIVQLEDKLFNSTRGSDVYFVVIELFDLIRDVDFFPLALVVKDFDVKGSKVELVDVYQVIGLHKILAIGADTNAINELRFVESELDPRFFFATFW